MTDRALQVVPALTDLSDGDVDRGVGYVGYLDLVEGASLTEGLPDRMRQAYDPIGLGYPVLMERDNYWQDSRDSGTENSAPVWHLDRAAWEAAGGETIGTVDLPAPKDIQEGTGTDRTVAGMMQVGNGRLVVLGGLLPTPTEEFAHWYGLSPHSLSIGGQELLLRALTVPASRDDSGAPSPSDGGAGPDAAPDPTTETVGGASQPVSSEAGPTTGRPLPATGGGAALVGMLLAVLLAVVRTPRRRG